MGVAPAARGYLICDSGVVEPLPACTDPCDVFDQGPLHRIQLKNGWQMYWTSASFHLSEVNPVATWLAKEQVKGDACLLHPDCGSDEWEDLLQKQSWAHQHPLRAARYSSDAWAKALQAPTQLGRQPCSTTADGGERSGDGGRHVRRVRAAHDVQSRILRGRTFTAAPPGAQHALMPPSAACTPPLEGAPDKQGPAAARGSSSPAEPSATRPASDDDVWALTSAPWPQLPAEVLSAIAGHVGHKAGDVLPLYCSSRCWHDAVLGDDILLRTLQFDLDVGRPVTARHPRGGQPLRRWLTGVAALPKLLFKAKAAHNVSALACCARLLDAAELPDQAMGCWSRCAKAGHLEGQLRYGLALYRGTGGVVQDAEAAFMYLSRAMKQVQAPPQGGAGGAAPARRQAPAAAAAADAAQQQLVREVKCQAGVVLGYLLFDGEGTRSDREEATRWFKLASEHGSKEAQEVLGWIFNTGQYGN